jgi:hypothetical protein
MFFFHFGKKNLFHHTLRTTNRESPRKKKKMIVDDSSDDEVVGMVYDVPDGEEDCGDDLLMNESSGDDENEASYGHNDVDGYEEMADASNDEEDCEFNDVIRNKSKKKRFVLRIAHGKSNASGFTTESDWVEPTDDENKSVDNVSSVAEDDSVPNDDQEENECILSNDDEGTSWCIILFIDVTVNSVYTSFL